VNICLIINKESNAYIVIFFEFLKDFDEILYLFINCQQCMVIYEYACADARREQDPSCFVTN